MEDKKVWGYAAAALSLGLLAGYLAFVRPLARTPVVSTTEPIHTVVSAKPAPKAPLTPAVQSPAARIAESERQARLAEIQNELEELPSVDSQALRTLARNIQAERARLNVLRENLKTSDRNLALASVSTAPNMSSQEQLYLEAQAAELESRLNDAKIAVDQQRQVIAAIADSNETVFMGQLYGELARRIDIANAIQQEIEELFGAEEADLEAIESGHSQQLAALRQVRAELAENYSDSLDQLEADTAAYQRMQEEQNHARTQSASLAAEKAELEKQSPPR
ncbi:MAG: hypothetical protein ACXWP1_11890 [Bdellovibrionota bacterium]